MGKGVWIVVVVIAIVLVGGFFIVKGYGSNQSNSATNGALPGTQNPSGSETSAGSEGMNPTAENQTAISQKEYAIDIQSFSFQPKSLIVKVGDIVTWTNKDSASHTVTSDSGNILKSPTLSNGKTFSYTFTNAGTYDYHCSIHTSMKGTVVVQ